MLAIARREWIIPRLEQVGRVDCMVGRAAPQRIPPRPPTEYDVDIVYDRKSNLVRTDNQARVAEYHYNPLGFRRSWKFDTDNDGDVDGNDKTYHFVHDERWRIVATYRDSDVHPKEQFVYHAAGYSVEARNRNQHGMVPSREHLESIEPICARYSDFTNVNLQVMFCARKVKTHPTCCGMREPSADDGSGERGWKAAVVVFALWRMLATMLPLRRRVCRSLRWR